MSEKMFFMGHSLSKILGGDHVIDGRQIVHHLIRKTANYDKKPNKTWSMSTVLIITKKEGFRSLEKVCLDILNWSFGFQPKISFVFPKSLC